MSKDLEMLAEQIKQKSGNEAQPWREINNLFDTLGLALAAEEIGGVGIYITANADEEVEQGPRPGSRNHGKSWSFILRESEVQIIIAGEEPEDGWTAFRNRGNELATELLDQIDRPN